MSDADSPDSLSAGASEGAAAVQTDGGEKQFRKSHGGARNRTGYAEKLLCMETHSIRSFLAEKRCFCGQNCLHKLAQQREAAEKTVYDMRQARFSSK